MTDPVAVPDPWEVREALLLDGTVARVRGLADTAAGGALCHGRPDAVVEVTLADLRRLLALVPPY